MSQWAYSPEGITCTVPSTQADPEQNRGPSKCPDCDIGDPIRVSVGNKYEQKQEFVGNGIFPLVVAWTYNSSGIAFGASEYEKVFGRNRSTHYGRSVHSYSNGTISTAYLTRPDGNLIRFNQQGADWIGPPGSDGKLLTTASGWEYRAADGSVELYNTAGQLISLVNKDGFAQALVYDAKYRLQSVIDPEGRKLTFVYNNPQGTIKTAMLPDGSELQFDYDTDNNLKKVTYPGGGFMEYRYNETGYVATGTRKGALTGVLDEAQQRYSSTAYDANTYATSSYAPGNVDRFDVAYSNVANGYAAQAAITLPSGRTRTVGYSAQHGKTHPNSYVEQCSGCAVASEAYTYDTNGRLDTTTDKRGVITDFDWNSRGKVVQRIEAANDTTGKKRTTQTDWDATLAVPTERRTYNATGALVQKETWTYNSRGQVLTHSIIDL